MYVSVFFKLHKFYSFPQLFIDVASETVTKWEILNGVYLGQWASWSSGEGWLGRFTGVTNQGS